MTHQLQDMLRDEAALVDVPPPPLDAILTGGRRLRRANRMRGALAVAASVAVVAGGILGVDQLVVGGERGQAPAPADTPTSPPPTLPAPVGGPLEVSGSGVAGHRFGTPADRVLAEVTAHLGEPDLSVGPQRYVRMAGQDGWFADADDPFSPSWQYPVASVSCWRTLCLVFGGEASGALELRGWELARSRRWSDFEEIEDTSQPDVRLAGSGLGLGDSWAELHAAYPRTVVGGAAGASLAVEHTPWDGVSDGAAEWRLSGQWDHTRPDQAPDGAVVTRLSGGEGPEPGCC